MGGVAGMGLGSCNIDVRMLGHYQSHPKKNSTGDHVKARDGVKKNEMVSRRSRRAAVERSFSLFFTVTPGIDGPPPLISKPSMTFCWSVPSINTGRDGTNRSTNGSYIMPVPWQCSRFYGQQLAEPHTVNAESA